MKKIMFNDKYGLTNAVLSGRKTETRRLIPSEFISLTWDVRGNTLVYENAYGDFIDIRNSKYCLYKLGEVVAVAQSYQSIYNEFSLETIDVLLSGLKLQKGWTNKMNVKPSLMPYQIRITGVRVERLQDISEEDCMKEGIVHSKLFNKYYFESDMAQYSFISPREAYASLIDKVSGWGTWLANPWVLVYEFELVQ